MDLYYRIPEYPEKLSGASILVRLLDGLGFRFRWSTEGLREEDYKFRPAPDCMSLEELVRHIWGLINWVCKSMQLDKIGKHNDILDVRSNTLEMIYTLREVLLSLNDIELVAIQIREKPFWHIVNGPIADALTHVGQINSFRRLSGNPTPKARVFNGLPPKERIDSEL
ncbi:MAG: hypothetical protein JSV58_01135 [Candidatus Bathyarchaeota archaeon]|nr:MAG: hypothetical protein JSV58_01135 [Candidatus Bathyarchaeota archaeon]